MRRKMTAFYAVLLGAALVLAAAKALWGALP